MIRFRAIVTLGVSVGVIALTAAAWWKTAQELSLTAAANASLRKTLGEMSVAITEKDREIDHMAQSHCGAGNISRP